MKKRFLLSAALVLSMCACSSSSATTETPKETPAETPAEETGQKKETTLDSGQLVDVLLNELGVSLGNIDDIHVPLADEDNNFKLTFTLNGEEYFCKINGTTGEVIEHNVPDDILKAVKAAGDPADAALDAAFNALKGYNGGAEDIVISQSGPTTYTVDFNWNGEHYTFNYDADQGKIID